MGLLLTVVIAVALGAIWMVVVRSSGRRKRLAGAPAAVEKVLGRYRKGEWDEVIAAAPDLLARPTDDGDRRWRPALELALGHSLVERERYGDAVAHLERGLLLQSAARRAAGRADAPDPGEAKLRHVLGYAYAEQGRPAQARREYRRVLDQPDLEPAVRRGVEASLAALDD